MPMCVNSGRRMLARCPGLRIHPAVMWPRCMGLRAEVGQLSAGHPDVLATLADQLAVMTSKSRSPKLLAIQIGVLEAIAARHVLAVRARDRRQYWIELQLAESVTHAFGVHAQENLVFDVLIEAGR